MLPETWGWPGGLPELLRNKGELRLFKGSGDALRGAEELSPARLGGLRRNPSVGVAGGDQPRPFAARPRAAGGARDLLASVCDRFTEGFGTADLQEAKRLIDALP
jgi:hypothetical protein